MPARRRLPVSGEFGGEEGGSCRGVGGENLSTVGAESRGPRRRVRFGVGVSGISTTAVLLLRHRASTLSFSGDDGSAVGVV